MCTYAVTGGTNGIGAKTIEILKRHGHDIVNIDISGGDINADLGTVEGRELVIRKLREHFPDGLDGFVCNHGIGGLAKFKPSYILSVNYFSAVALLDGLYDLLKKKKGNCVVISSGSIAYAKRGKYFVDELLTNCCDEKRICRLVDKFDSLNSTEKSADKPGENFVPAAIANTMYLSSKIALARWVRRISSSWAQHGVNINAVCPGAVSTSIMQGMKKPSADVFFYPMPAIPDQEGEMIPDDVAHVIAFMVMPGANGMSGSILFSDAGASAIIDPEKY